MNKKEKFYITTPIYYPSGVLHIGNCYTTIIADTMARYKRLRGYDVMFLTGTDEHGQKIENKAKQKGVTPIEYVDEMVATVKKLWDLYNISYDDFIRTTEDRHINPVKIIFKKLYEQGDIYKGFYEGLYCTPCESFWTEMQLKDGKCQDCGREVHVVKEEAYFLKLSKYQDRLLKYIEENPDFIQPVYRKNEMINNFIKPGLEDLCVSRTSFSWGIPVDFDNKHVVYVWLDALTNYITSLGYMSDNADKLNKYWPADIHLVGKEIIRFHTIIWPIILMALDLPLPKKVYGHGWLVIDGGQKISKSKDSTRKDTIADPYVVAEKFGVDAIRYYLMREISMGMDGNISYDGLINRINRDLANDLGNLVSRTVAMIEKYFDGEVINTASVGDFDEDLKDTLLKVTDKVENEMENMQFNVALSEIWKAISRTNKYIDETTPWNLSKEPANPKRLSTVLYNLIESIRIISIVLEPFMPITTQKIWEQIGLKRCELTTWDSSKKFGLYPTANRVKKGEALFPRIEIEKQKKLPKAEEVKVLEEVKKELLNEKKYISIDDFAKVELKVGKVLYSEKVEGSDKLLKSEVDLGTEKRIIVSGIAKYYDPKDLIGKKVIVVTNLKPIKLRGIESNGMIIAAGEGENFALCTVEKDIEIGTTIS